jgi:FMN reductase
VGIGGSTRAGSSTEEIVGTALAAFENYGVKTQLFAGKDLILPPHEQTPQCVDAGRHLIAAVRRADALVIGLPDTAGASLGSSRMPWTISKSFVKRSTHISKGDLSGV